MPRRHRAHFHARVLLEPQLRREGTWLQVADGLWAIGGLCHDLQVGQGGPRALPGEAATSHHACSYTSHRAGPGSAVLCLPPELKESHLSDTELQATSQAMIQEQWVEEKEKVDHPSRDKIIT